MAHRPTFHEVPDAPIDPKDLRIDTVISIEQANGPVRITHIPTGTVVIGTGEPTEMANKARTMHLLRERLRDSFS